MVKRIALFICLFLISISVYSQNFTVGKGVFNLNGEPFIIKAAELHYPRIPKPYWEHRIKMCKALGMNTICLYVFWNAHEEEPGIYDFNGQLDLAEFCRLCQENGMYVILRPGPYVCAEWEMGGLPWWLLKNKDVRLREDDLYFIERVDRFEEQVAKQVGNMTVDKGGPIIMIQVENEYGSYGTNKEYIKNIRDIIREHFGDEIVLFQCDWCSNFTNNALDDLLWTINFGTGADINQQFELLKQLRPESPLMCSEFWSGWFDKWGANHETRSADAMISGIDEMLQKNISFSLYMTHGGTNWGHWAGANSPGYSPDVTSYDYDAPISESGQITPKYILLRSLLEKYSNDELPSIPSPINTISITPFIFEEVAPLFDNLPEPRYDEKIHSMEYYDQGFGSILYRTALPEISIPSTLKIDEAHDYAQIFINDRLIGCIDRRKGESEILIPQCQSGDRLDILVEAMGRINFGRAIKDYKGITNKVVVLLNKDNTEVIELKKWEIYNIKDELDYYKSMAYDKINSLTDSLRQRIPGCYRATFNVNKPGDTFLNLETWGKGLVYVNGHPLGRFWSIGPQQTLYMPGCWLKEGENEIVVFDIIGPKEVIVEGLDSPIINKLNLEESKSRKIVNLNDCELVSSGEFKSGNGWQCAKFASRVEGQVITIEILNSHNSKNQAAIAEIYLIDKDGNRLSREGWTVLNASSEDVEGVNHTAEKIFDLQESTYWMSDPEDKFPHTITIDLGRTSVVTGIEYLPRTENDAPASVKEYKVYLHN